MDSVNPSSESGSTTSQAGSRGHTARNGRIAAREGAGAPAKIGAQWRAKISPTNSGSEWISPVAGSRTAML